ncbi:MAG: RT0821/Lpp0805 family surface protein [Candidatus Competibacter sp.]
MRVTEWFLFKGVSRSRDAPFEWLFGMMGFRLLNGFPYTVPITTRGVSKGFGILRHHHGFVEDPAIKAVLSAIGFLRRDASRVPGAWISPSEAVSAGGFFQCVLKGLIGQGYILAGHSRGHGFAFDNRDLRNAGLSVSLADEAVIQKALTQGLEKELSGTRVAWRNPDTGHQGEIVPIRTFQSENGQYCREFREFRTVAGSTYDQGGIACRQAEGVWKMRIRYLPENGGV